MDERELIEHAYRAREYAYTPYSDFRVGAALLTKSGKLYYGCNIESASYTPTNCAERTAFFKAVSEGEREFEGIAIVGGKGTGRSGNVCAPCGVCRQVMQDLDLDRRISDRKQNQRKIKQKEVQEFHACISFCFWKYFLIR